MQKFKDTQDYTQRSYQLSKQLEELKNFQPLLPIYGSYRTVNAPLFGERKPPPKKPYVTTLYETKPAASNVPYYMRPK